jgi:hypothetical protein
LRRRKPTSRPLVCQRCSKRVRDASFSRILRPAIGWKLDERLSLYQGYARVESTPLGGRAFGVREAVAPPKIVALNQSWPSCTTCAPEGSAEASSHRLDERLSLYQGYARVESTPLGGRAFGEDRSFQQVRFAQTEADVAAVGLPALLEAGARRELQPADPADLPAHLDQLILRPAIGWKLDERLSLYQGYARVESTPLGRRSSR